jgi:glycerophosphoryl diester phosphodiesterase
VFVASHDLGLPASCVVHPPPGRSAHQNGRVQQRLPSLLTRPVAFAHRGARAHARENTLDAFALALRLGATGLESDVWLTADGVPVLDHDGVVRTGRTGRSRRPLTSFRREELPEHVPALTDLLERCGTDYHLSLDVKHPDAGPMVVATVREAAPELLPRLWLCQARLADSVELRALDPDVRVVDSTRLARLKEGPERRAATLAAEGIDAINMHHSDWTGGLATLFHRFERVTFGWDMQYEHILRPALRMGLDGVYSDHVDVMVDAFIAEFGDRP